MRLFLYGTLLVPDALGRRSGDPALNARGVTATLPGWERVILPGGRWPTLRRRPGGSVAGRIVAVGAEAARRLAAYEGSAYRLRHVVVATAQGNRAARAFIAPGGTRRPWKE